MQHWQEEEEKQQELSALLSICLRKGSHDVVMWFHSEGVGEIIVSRNLLFYSIVKGIKVFAYSGQFKQFWKPLDDC